MRKGKTIRGDRFHIGFFGRRNAGKSSLINAVSGQKTAIVSEIPGTTTDPVYKSMELQPIGPVILIDTAGLDDENDSLGNIRVKSTEKVLHRTNLALVVIDATNRDFTFENQLINTLQSLNITYLLVLNKTDLGITREALDWMGSKPFIRVSTKNVKGIEELKKQMKEIAPKEWEPPFIRDLIKPGDIVVLVTPIDLGAPKGRLIMPQVKAIRDILDGDGIPVICKERELLTTLNQLKEKPALVVTDSQVFPQVAADVPEDTPLTSFSILSARQKGDLRQFVNAIATIKNLRHSDKILIAESCTHHPMEDDIGRIKIPRWLNYYAGGGLEFKFVSGTDFPDQLQDYKLVVHCGACTLNRREMLRRQHLASSQGVAIVNYGVLISFLKSVFPRALKPFPELYQSLKNKTENIDVQLKRQLAKSVEI